MEGIGRALVLSLVLIAGTAIEHDPSVGPLPSVVLFFVPVPAFLVGVVLSGSPVATCFRPEIVSFDTCKSAAI